MPAQTLTVQLPEPLYTRLAERAHRANRPVEAELLTVLESAVNGDERLPDELAEAVASLELMTDDELWRAARNHLVEECSRRTEELHHKRQREGLTAAEENEVAGLVRQYERVMLIRAEAAGLLKGRGHDISGLLVP